MHQQSQILYIHIPKAAGSSINKLVVECGLEDSRVHIERERSIDFQSSRNSTVKFCSGHLTYAEYTRFFDQSEWCAVSVLRNPIDRLISHFNWMRELWNRRETRFFTNHPQEIQSLASRMGGIDFSNPDELQEFVDTLEPIGRLLFDNCMVRYLSAENVGLVCNRADLSTAFHSVTNLRLVGTVEALPRFLEHLAPLVGFEAPTFEYRENVLDNTYQVDGAKDFEKIVEPLVSLDRELYDFVNSM